jgi:hypothetical protein
MLSGEDRGMAFNIQHDETESSVTVGQRSEALAIVSDWLKAGRAGIKIIGVGRIYSPEEFAATIINDASRPTQD